MRVLVLTQHFHPENFRINQLATALSQAGHEVTVLTAQPNYPSGRFFDGYSFLRPLRSQYEGIEVIRVPIFPRGRGRWFELVLNYLSFIFFATAFGLPRLRGKFDICINWCTTPITSAIPAVFYRAWSGTPVAIWVQDLWPETFFAVTKSQNVILKWSLKKVVSWIYRHVDQIWMQSPGYKSSILAHGAREEQIHFVPNWAEDLYNCDGWSLVQGESLPPNSFVFAGNLGRAQGLENLLEAIEQVVKAEGARANFVFVGDGVLREWFETEVKSRQLSQQVKFQPRRPPSEMPRILKSASALLVTLGDDPVYAQTIPSKVQSSLASGRPIIASLFGESANVVTISKSGFITGPRDASGLAKSIKDFLSLPDEEKEKLGRNGHAYYLAHFTQKQIVQDIVNLLERMRSR